MQKKTQIEISSEWAAHAAEATCAMNGCINVAAAAAHMLAIVNACGLPLQRQTCMSREQRGLQYLSCGADVLQQKAATRYAKHSRATAARRMPLVVVRLLLHHLNAQIALDVGLAGGVRITIEDVGDPLGHASSANPINESQVQPNHARRLAEHHAAIAHHFPLDAVKIWSADDNRHGRARRSMKRKPLCID